MIDWYYTVILLFGAIVSLLLAFGLWMHPAEDFSSRILASFVVFWAVPVTGFALQSNDFFIRFPHFYGVTTGFLLLIFPTLYVYIKSYLRKPKRGLMPFMLHYVPFLSYWVFLSPFLAIDAGTKSRMIINWELPDMLFNLFKVVNYVVITQGIVYSVMSFRYLHYHQYFSGVKFSQGRLKGMKWLKVFIVANISLWGLGTTGVLLESLSIATPVDLFLIFYLSLSMLTLLMGFSVLFNPHWVFPELGGKQGPDYIKEMMQNKAKSAKREGKKSREELELNKKDLETLLNHLQQERPYLNTGMSLQDLATGTGMSKHRISELLNKELNKSFYELLNEFRTREACRLIEDGLHKQHTLTHLAEQAGFNSKATFNRIFKKITGYTPSQYILFSNAQKQEEAEAAT